MVSRLDIRKLHAQRASESGETRGWLYYHQPPNDSLDIFEDCFGIVEKSFWDRHHHLDDRGVCKRLPLPPGFGEVEESIFSYHNEDGSLGSVTEAEELLNLAGLTKIDYPQKK